MFWRSAHTKRWGAPAANPACSPAAPPPPQYPHIHPTASTFNLPHYNPPPSPPPLHLQLDSYFVLALKIEPPPLDHSTYHPQQQPHPQQPGHHHPSPFQEHQQQPPPPQHLAFRQQGHLLSPQQTQQPHPPPRAPPQQPQPPPRRRFSAVWARSSASVLGHDHYQLQRRLAPTSAPVLWLLCITTLDPGSTPGESAPGASSSTRGGGGTPLRPRPPSQQLVQLHAVRGLSAVVVSSFGGGMSSSGGGKARPQALLFGEHLWEGAGVLPAPHEGGSLPALAGGAVTLAAPHLQQEQQLLSCWLTAETEFPIVHCFTSSSGSGGSASPLLAHGGLLLRGRSFATLPDEFKHPHHSLAPVSPQEHQHTPGHATPPHLRGVGGVRQLAVLRAWDAAAVGHCLPVAAAAAAAVAGGALLATADPAGRVLLWDAATLQALHSIALPPLQRPLLLTCTSAAAGSSTTTAAEAAAAGGSGPGGVQALAWLVDPPRGGSGRGGQQEQEGGAPGVGPLLVAAAGRSLHCWAVDVQLRRLQRPGTEQQPGTQQEQQVLPVWEVRVPQACGALHAMLVLHPACSSLPAGSSSGGSSGGDRHALVCLGAGSHLVVWACSGRQPLLWGVLPLPAVAAGAGVAAAAAVPGLPAKLLLGLEAGPLLLAHLDESTAGSNSCGATLRLTVLAQLPLPPGTAGQLLALAADEGGAHVAALCGGSSGGGTTVLVWQQAATEGGSEEGSGSPGEGVTGQCPYTLVASNSLPPSALNPSASSRGGPVAPAAALTWLADMPVPCLAVSGSGCGVLIPANGSSSGSPSGGVLLLAPGRASAASAAGAGSGGTSGGWRWVAGLPLPGPVSRLVVCSGCVNGGNGCAGDALLAVQGRQLVLLSDEVGVEGHAGKSIAR